MASSTARIDLALEIAGSTDVPAIAALHAVSWRNAYRGMLPDEFLDNEVVANRLAFWKARLKENSPESDRRLVLKALDGTELAGFVCVLLDAEPAWGARLDNLHVRPELKGKGIGHALFAGAREWIARVSPGQSMHLWVVEANHVARQFYDREGGRAAERTLRDVVQGLAVPELRYVWPPLASF